MTEFEVRTIGRVESALSDPGDAPRQADEGAPAARLVFEPEVAEGLRGLRPGDRVLVVTWLDRARRDVLSVHPRGDTSHPLAGVFTTRAPHRPNPIGLHEVEIAAIEGNTVEVCAIEAVDGTPILDLKPVLEGPGQRVPARSGPERRRDTVRRFERDVDAWIGTADPATGTPYLVPLSFLWDGGSLVVATVADSPTARNLCATGRVRVGLGPTRDVVLVEGTAQPLPLADVPAELGDAFAAKTGFDPRKLSSPYLYFRIRPGRVQAWREANELRGRDLMRNAEWVVAD